MIVMVEEPKTHLPGAGAAIGSYLILWGVIMGYALAWAAFSQTLRGIFPNPQVFFGVAALGQAVLIVAVLVWFVRLRGFDERETFSLKPARLSLCFWAAVGIIALGMVVGYLASYVVQAMPWLVSKELETLVQLARFGDPLAYLFYALALGIGPGVSEELAFRGVILRGLRSKLSIGGAVALSALFFAVIHIDLLQGLIAFFTGLYVGYWVERSGSIYPAIFAHAFNNLWSTVEASLWQAYNPQMGAREILLSTGYPPVVLGAAALVLVISLYALHRLTKSIQPA